VIERFHRLVLCLVAVALTVALYMKSHGISRMGDDVAFLPDGTARVGKETIRIRGSIMNPGVYQIYHGAELKTVMKMTLGGVREGSWEKALTDSDIQTGDVLEITQRDGHHLEINKKNMTVREKMILGISLDPNQLTAEDWEKLPGIGSVTAEKIVADRQNNGGFSSVIDLKRVSGIGDAKIKQLEHLFK
jgi:competence protein ComEA